MQRGGVGVELAFPPDDGITSLNFSKGQKTQDLLVVSSWDQQVRVYSVSTNTLRYSYNHGAPALDCCFLDNDSQVVSAGLDKCLKKYALDSGSAAPQVLGVHDETAKCLVYIEDQDLVISGSWDKTVRAWDHRVSTGEGHTKAVHKLPMPGKVFSMDSHGHRLVVAMAQRKIHIYDTRKLDPKHAEIETETLLKYQTRSVRCFPNGLGYAVGSIEGRVSMEYFSQDPDQQKKKYAFKCHRRVTDGVEYVYPVNALAFHPIHGTFATGGCDGIVNTWDGENKKRLYQYARYQTSIADLSFNSQGTKLAVAASYTFEQGEKDHPLDAIFVRDVNENEVKPKPKKQ
jgi:cell cycle arrest protein BUB3